jgi:N-methylhydantoinase A
VEIVNFRLTAVGALERPPLPRFEAASGASAPVTHRPVHFRDRQPLETPIYERARLAPGQRIAGPAVIEQMDATTLLHPGDRLAVDAVGNLIVEVGG